MEALKARRSGAALLEVKPRAVKKSLTGHGGASKAQMQRAIQERFGLDAPPKPADVADALAIVGKYAIDAPAPVLARLRAGDDETPKPGDPRLAGVETLLVASPQASLEAAARLAANSLKRMTP